MNDRRGEAPKPIGSSEETLRGVGRVSEITGCATMTHTELIVRNHDLEIKAFSLQQLVCHLLHKNEMLRQELYFGQMAQQ
jgi:hypothetical protein